MACIALVGARDVPQRFANREWCAAVMALSAAAGDYFIVVNGFGRRESLGGHVVASAAIVGRAWVKAAFSFS